MVENLKSIRLIHNLIIVSCAALTILVFSKQPFQNIFDEALAELELILPAFNTMRNKEVELVHDFYRRSGTLSLLNETFNGLPFEPIGNYNWDFQRDRFEEIENRLVDTNGSWFFTNMVVYELDFENRTDQLRSWYQSCVKTAQARNSRLIKWIIIYRGRGNKATLELYDGTGQAGGFSAPILSETEITDSYLIAREIVFNNDLIQVVNGDTVTFPRLKEVWDVVKPLTIGEAKDALLRHSRSSREQSAKPLSIFGLTIESRDASLFGPILVISLLVYLLAQVRHLASIRPKDFKTLVFFPWVGFFDDLIGKVILLFTILIFPLISSVMIVIVSNYSIGRKSLLIFIYSLILILLASSLLRAIHLLKQEIKQNVTKGISG